MSLLVLDWRRQVHALYAAVRADPSPGSAHELWRARRDDLLAHHGASPVPPAARVGFAGASYDRYDPLLRFELTVETDLEEATFEVETGTDGIVRFSRLGRVRVPGVGPLDCWWHDGYGGGVFLPFADPNPSVYGGGRYLIDTTKGADLGGDLDPTTGSGCLVVDLNFAYNPSCAYDPSWACPLPPVGNRLPVPVHAGELFA